MAGSPDSKTVRIAHISDLHYQCKNPNEKLIASIKKQLDEPVLKKLFKIAGSRALEAHDENILNHLITKLKQLKPDLLVISGDITNFGDAESLRRIKERISELKLSDDHIIVVPGNHDVLQAKFDGRGAFEYFAECWPNAFPRAVYLEVKDIVLLLFLFNSNWSSDPATSLIYIMEGLISSNDFNRFNSLLIEMEQGDTEKFKRSFKIAVLHHHPLPIPYKTVRGDTIENLESKFTVMENGATFARYLNQKGIDLVLHGHEHLDCCAHVAYDGDSRLSIVSAASASQAHQEYNGFNLVEVDVNHTVWLTKHLFKETGFDAPPEPAVIRGKARPCQVGSEPLSLNGNTIGEVYSLIKRLFVKPSGRFIYNLTTYIDCVKSGLPEPAGSLYNLDELQKFARALLEKSNQKVKQISEYDYSHGERIHMLRYHAEDKPIDQLDEVVGKLKAKSNAERRAIVSIYNSLFDLKKKDDEHVPAFQELQFYITEHKVNAMGFFRAQEMCYFWLVNVIECQFLINEVVERLNRGRSKLATYKPGSLSMTTTMAYWDADSGLEAKPLLEQQTDQEILSVVGRVCNDGSPLDIDNMLKWLGDKKRFRRPLQTSGLTTIAKSCRELKNTRTNNEAIERLAKLEGLAENAAKSLDSLRDQMGQTSEYIENKGKPALDAIIEFLQSLKLTSNNGFTK